MKNIVLVDVADMDMTMNITTITTMNAVEDMIITTTNAVENMTTDTTIIMTMTTNVDVDADVADTNR